MACLAIECVMQIAAFLQSPKSILNTINETLCNVPTELMVHHCCISHSPKWMQYIIRMVGNVIWGTTADRYCSTNVLICGNSPCNRCALDDEFYARMSEVVAKNQPCCQKRICKFMMLRFANSIPLVTLNHWAVRDTHARSHRWSIQTRSRQKNSDETIRQMTLNASWVQRFRKCVDSLKMSVV